MPFKNTYSTFDDVECGLVSIHNGFVLPLHLQKCHVSVEVINHIGHYIVNQTYENLTDDTLEATYIFPIQEGGAVHYFTAESNGQVIEGVVKEKSADAGTQDYDEDSLAMGDNRTGFLISEFKPDLYQLALGELAPNSITTIELKYVCELPIENNAVKLAIPNTVAPQYSKPTTECEEKTAADQLVDLDKDLDIEIYLKVRQTVAFKVDCDPHEIVMTDGQGVDEDGFYYSTGSLTLQRTGFDEEQMVFVSTVSGKVFGARILIEETSKGEVAGMVTLVPEFPAADYQSEMIFLVDRSGSMSGRSIEKAKEALHIFLASLPSDCKFNICSFNASYDFLFETPQPYNDTTLADARQYTDNMQAGGGTRVYEPLETIFKQDVGDGCKRQIFVLTDGHVSRPQESVTMVGKYTTVGRVFSLGIGEDASRVLVNGLARAGNGTALFVTLAEDLKDKVLELLSSSLLPGLSNITLDWLSDMKPQKTLLSIFKASGDAGTVMKLKENSAPNPIPHAFSSQLSIVYQSLEFGNLPVGLRISGTGPDGDVMLVVNLDSTKVMQSELLHKLMARRMVKMLEEDDKMGNDSNVQARMTTLGTNYNINNKWCSSVSTGQFGAAKKGGAASSAPPDAGSAFVPAPAGIVRRSSSRSPSPPRKSAGAAMFGAKKGKKKKSAGPPMLMKSAPTSSYSATESMMQQRAQVSNTRWAKSKNMSNVSAPFAMKQTRSMKMQRSSSPVQQMQVQQMSNCMMSMSSSDSGSSLDQALNESAPTIAAAPPPPPPVNIGKVRDEMLQGFTVLQKTDGSFAFGPAFIRDLNMTEPDVDEGAKKLGVSKELLLTLVVVIYLRSMMSNRKSSWSRMGEKADGFIAANIGETDLLKLEEDVEKFMDGFVQQSRSKVLFKGYKKKK